MMFLFSLSFCVRPPFFYLLILPYMEGLCSGQRDLISYLAFLGCLTGVGACYLLTTVVRRKYLLEFDTWW